MAAADSRSTEMFRRLRRGGPIGRSLAAALVALALVAAMVGQASAHARYDSSDPPAGAMLDGQPFVLRAYFTQELSSRSTIRVLDASGAQVDLADGRVDLDDPGRKLMLVSLPALPPGVYTVEWSTLSIEDGDWEVGTFELSVGPAEAPATPSGETWEWHVLDAY
jgi:methionine-rich copper-binding protein CopC